MKKRIKIFPLFFGRPGFTLIEMLLGLTLFALVGASIYSLYSQAVRIQRAADESGAVVGQIRWAFDILTRDLENAVRWTHPGTGKDFLTWKKDEITFLTATAKGLSRVRYSLKQPETVHIHQIIVNQAAAQPGKIVFRMDVDRRAVFLVREELPWREDTGEGEASTGEEILATQVVPNSLHFYFAKQESPERKNAILWQSEWQSSSPPVGVRVEVALLGPEEESPFVTWQKDIFIPSGSRDPQQSEP